MMLVKTQLPQAALTALAREGVGMLRAPSRAAVERGSLAPEIFARAQALVHHVRENDGSATPA